MKQNDYVDENYPNYFKTISDGLNTRITQQCTRQGPSIYDKDDTIQPQNLAFGRPPVF